MGNFTNKLTEEELKALLKELPEDNKDKQDLSKNDVLDFLSYYGLEAGSHLIPYKLIYSLYQKWSKNPLSDLSFKYQVSYYLATNNKGSYYLINQDVLKLNKYLFNYLNGKLIQKKVVNYRPHFINFINHYNIKTGNLWLEPEVFYYLYDLWMFNKKKKLNSVNISKLCSLHFPTKILKDQKTYFGVDNGILITKKQIQEIKEGIAFKNGKKKKRKTKAK